MQLKDIVIDTLEIQNRRGADGLEWKMDHDRANTASVSTQSKTPQPLVYMSDQHTLQDLHSEK